MSIMIKFTIFYQLCAIPPIHLTLSFQDPYAQDAASSLVADPYTPELNPYNLQPSGAGAEAAGK